MLLILDMLTVSKLGECLCKYLYTEFVLRHLIKLYQASLIPVQICLETRSTQLTLADEELARTRGKFNCQIIITAIRDLAGWRFTCAYKTAFLVISFHHQ